MYFSARQLWIALTIWSAFFTQALAQPAILHEEARIALPAPYYGADHVCLRGIDMLIVARRPDPADPSGHSMWAFVHFKKQANGQWQFEQEVAAASYDHFADYWTHEDLACERGLAAFSGPGSYSFIFELTSAGWQATPISLGFGYPAGAAIHEDAVAFSGKWQAPATIAVVRKDTSGQWTDVSYIAGHPGYVIDPEVMGPSDMEYAGTEAVATGNSYHSADWSEILYDMQVFDLVDGVWQVTSRPSDSYPTILGDRIALYELLPWSKPGEVASLKTRDNADAWTVERSLLSDEALYVSNISVHGDRAIASNTEGTGEIVVFNQEDAQRYRHEATLMASDAPAPGREWASYSVDGEWIATVDGTNDNVYVYRVPADLPAAQRLEETFEDNNAADWIPWGDANWQIVSSGGSRAYRQASTVGGARAILSTFESADQSIQADVRIESMAGPSPWAGFMVRYTDPQNFYYLLVDRTSVQIRRMLNGVYGPIATAPFDLELGRTYRFRIEAIGARLRAFVDGALVTEALDEMHPQGNVALTMWRSATEYDNVVVTTSPQTTLHVDDFSQQWPATAKPWSKNSSTWSFITNGDVTAYRQSSLSGRLTAVNGGPTGDQIVSAEVRPRTFNGLASAGLIARYVDGQNHYFVVLTSDHRVALRKRINGATYRIGDAPLTVTPGASYRVRLEVIGSSIRAYVDDELLLEAQDGALPTGRYGLMAFQTAVDFDTFVAIRP